MLDDAQGAQQLAAEALGTAAVVSERGERVEARRRSLVFAEVGLEAPDRDENFVRDAEALADLAEERGVRRELLLAVTHARGRHV